MRYRSGALTGRKRKFDSAPLVKDHNEPLLGEYTLSGRNASTRDGRSRGLTLVRVYEGRQHGVNSISL